MTLPPTPNVIIDRETYTTLIQRIIDGAMNGSTPFAGLEVYGLRGQGKSRLIADTIRVCHDCSIPFATVRFSPAMQQGSLEYQCLQVINNICAGLEHHAIILPERDLFAALMDEEQNRAPQPYQGDPDKLDPGFIAQVDPHLATL